MSFCDVCRFPECRCDQPAEGYECQECGEVPTWRELQSGSCTPCVEDRMAEKRAAQAAQQEARS